jgi:hypothetical protein
MKGNEALQKVCYQTTRFLKNHSATILTFVGVVGVVATAVSAAKATPKALELLDKATEEKGEELTKTEIVKTAGPAYIPSVLIGASTIACVFGANVLNKHQQATIVSAYALANNAYKEYRGKVVELFGEETDNKVRDAIAMDKRNEEITAYAPGQGPLVVSRGEKLLFYEEHRGKYFEATMEDVINAEYHLNRNLTLRGYTDLNEFYSFLGLEPTDFGDGLGWDSWKLQEMYDSQWIDFVHRKTTVSDDGLECYFIEMLFPPYLFEES